MKDTSKIRNIAIIAHVDHGKTTLIDKLLLQTEAIKQDGSERVMDKNDLEQERGITILAKNATIQWNNHKINIIDTPGHADFGGEVERVLSMTDSVLLLVDAQEGVMPQTRFVTEKSFKQGLKPIVVINKIDKPGSRCDFVIEQVFELFYELGATEEQLDFTVIYASAVQGYASLTENKNKNDMADLLNTIIEQCPAPQANLDKPLQLQISQLDYSSYIGLLGIGKIMAGVIQKNQQILLIDKNGKITNPKVSQIFAFKGLQREEIQQSGAGDIVAIAGLGQVKISDTICELEHINPLPALEIEEPTMSINLQVNDSPFVGKDGSKFITSRQLWERLQKETMYNVALKIEETQDTNIFKVSGRGELHLSVLLETMRRELYEFAVSKPTIITKTIDSIEQEPFENLVIDIPIEYQGTIMEEISYRKGELVNMQNFNTRVRLDYLIPSRGIIGFRSKFLKASSGQGIMHSSFSCYKPLLNLAIINRKNGVLISNGMGKSIAYALFSLQDRGKLFIEPQIKVYEGMIIGLHNRDNDLTVNCLKAKKLTNIRAAGSDENILLEPPIKFSLEQALDFINDDELLEITPKHIYFRKKLLTENERKVASRKK